MNNQGKGFGKNVCYKSLAEAGSFYKGEKGFCSVIALAVATGCKFGKAKRIMDTEGSRSTGRGASTRGITKAFNACGYHLEPFNTRSGFMVKNAARYLPSVGTFIIYSSAHVTCMKNGIIEDWVMLQGAKGKKMQSVHQVIEA